MFYQICECNLKEYFWKISIQRQKWWGQKSQKEKEHLQGDGVKTTNMIADLAGQRNSSQLVDENFGQ